MSIKKENNGTYTVNFVRTDIITNKKTRTKKRGFKTLREAKAYERTLNSDTSEQPFQKLFQECLASKDITDVTRKDTLQLFDKYLSDLSNLTYKDMDKPFMLTLRSRISHLEISAVVKNKLIGIIKSTFKYLSEYYDLPDTSKVLKNFKRDTPEMTIWTPQEFSKFEDSLKGKYDPYIPFFHLLFWSGMRKGEARALLIDDLDVENATITINKSMRRYKSSLKAPKTATSKRKIKIDINTLNLLKPLKSHEKWLFGDYKPLNLNMINKAFQYGIEKANLKKIRIHDLRHSHATFLICSGANIVAVSKRLGHKSINMTLSTYTHLLKEAESELVEIINVANR